MLTTASAVYEAVEPIVIWRNLFTILHESIADEQSTVSRRYDFG
jgi:hypothetical protein